MKIAAQHDYAHCRRAEYRRRRKVMGRHVEHRRGPGYPRVLWVRDVCQRLVGARLSRRAMVARRLCGGKVMVAAHRSGRVGLRQAS